MPSLSPLIAFALLALFPAMSPSASATSSPSAAIPVYFGNYAAAIQRADFDPSNGRLSDPRDAAPLARASFLAKSNDGRFLYAVAEGRAGGLHAFAIAADGSGELIALNSATSGGAGPADIALSPDGTLVAAANYGGGSTVVYRIEADGRLGERFAFFQHEHASGVVADRQKNPHAHGVTWSPDGRRLLVPDLGGDRVYLFFHDKGADTLTPNPRQAWLELPPGSGPRHAQFSPDGRHLYVINELANTVTAASWDADGGVLATIETVSTLPAEGFAGFTKTAELALTPDGRTLYASNRGHDSLAVFARDAGGGRLTLRDHVKVPANPRHFALSPDARWLLAAGQDAGRVEVFAVAPETGDLTPTGEGVATPKPVCVRF